MEFEPLKTEANCTEVDNIDDKDTNTVDDIDIDDEDLDELEEWYENLALERACGIRTIMARLENLQQEMRRTSWYNPFGEISYRIKSFESACDKCVRKGRPINRASLENLSDIAGIRIVTPFLDDIDVIKEALILQPSMFVVREKDYINNPKPNGYRSLHLIVDMDVYFMQTMKHIRVEIQIRTDAQDYWASNEHLLKYKNPNPSPEVEQTLRKLADTLAQAEQDSMAARNSSLREVEAAQKDPS